MKPFLLATCFILAIAGNPYQTHAQDLTSPGNYMTAIANAHVDMNKKYGLHECCSTQHPKKKDRKVAAAGS